MGSPSAGPAAPGANRTAAKTVPAGVTERNRPDVRAGHEKPVALLPDEIHAGVRQHRGDRVGPGPDDPRPQACHRREQARRGRLLPVARAPVHRNQSRTGLSV